MVWKQLELFGMNCPLLAPLVEVTLKRDVMTWQSGCMVHRHTEQLDPISQGSILCFF